MAYFVYHILYKSPLSIVLKQLNKGFDLNTLSRQEFQISEAQVNNKSNALINNDCGVNICNML